MAPFHTRERSRSRRVQIDLSLRMPEDIRAQTINITFVTASEAEVTVVRHYNRSEVANFGVRRSVPSVLTGTGGSGGGGVGGLGAVGALALVRDGSDEPAAMTSRPGVALGPPDHHQRFIERGGFQQNLANFIIAH